VLLLALTVVMVSGCQARETAESPKTAQTGATTKAADAPAEKVGAPLTITPDPGSLALKDPLAEATINVSDGVDEKEAQVAGAYYLRAFRENKLGGAFGATAEAYTLLNQVKVRGEWLLTYSRTTVDGQSADAYAVTVALDAKTGKQLRITEAP
jgi:hypothetical protein